MVKAYAIKWSLLFGLILFAGPLLAEDDSPLSRQVGSVTEPVIVEQSDFLGYTEDQLKKRLEFISIESDLTDDQKKFFRGEISDVPATGGYVYTRYHLLTFKEGRVVRHEIVDRVTACVISEPRTE